MLARYGINWPTGSWSRQLHGGRRAAAGEPRSYKQGDHDAVQGAVPGAVDARRAARRCRRGDRGRSRQAGDERPAARLVRHDRAQRRAVRCYNLRALYPFALGSSWWRARPRRRWASLRRTGTRATARGTLHRFKAEEDPDDKLRIVTRDGFWTGEGRDVPGVRGARRGTTCGRWTATSSTTRMTCAKCWSLLRADQSITAVSFRRAPSGAGSRRSRMATTCARRDEFTGCSSGGRLQLHGAPPADGADPAGRDLRTVLAGRGGAGKARDLMYHYSLVFPSRCWQEPITTARRGRRSE